MKSIFFFGLLFLALSSCNQEGRIANNKEEPVTYSTESDDQEMNNAITQAKNSLNEFDSALKSNMYDSSTFALKVAFPIKGGKEHIWATSITVLEGNYYGIIDNVPEMTSAVKSGPKIRLNKEDITDWMYGDRGALRGAYTLRVIRNRMTEEERKKFDAGFSLKISDE